MHKPQEQVQQQRRDVYNHPISPAEPKLRNPAFCATLILEEAIETACALVGSVKAQSIVQAQLAKVLQERAGKHTDGPDLLEAIDGCMDVLVVTYGALEDIGVDAEPFFDAVHTANMAKANGPIREDGKRLKPEGWKPADLAAVLRRSQSAEVG